jgi:F-type H+-transporting ATPase subunit b
MRHRVGIKSKIPTAIFLAALLAVGLGAGIAQAQSSGNGGQPAAATAPAAMEASGPQEQEATAPRKGADQEPEDEKQQYRVSGTTRYLARVLHISPEFAAGLFEWLNVGVLIVAVVWVVARFLPKAFRNREARIQRQLEEARQSTEESRRRLNEIEERLSRLDDEIIRLHGQSERDLQGEEERFRALMDSEKDKIIDSAEQEITAAGAQARRELKQLAAELAVGQAERKLQMTDDMDGKIIGRFAQTLGDKN